MKHRPHRQPLAPPPSTGRGAASALEALVRKRVPAAPPHAPAPAPPPPKKS